LWKIEIAFHVMLIKGLLDKDTKVRIAKRARNIYMYTISKKEYAKSHTFKGV